VYVNQSTISQNGASGGTGGYAWGGDFQSPGNGGRAAGGGIHVTGGTLEIRQSTLFGNGAFGGRSGWDEPDFAGVSEGGGLYIATAEPPIASLDSVTVSNTVNNRADLNPNIAGPYFLDGTPRLTVSNVTAREGNEARPPSSSPSRVRVRPARPCRSPTPPPTAPRRPPVGITRPPPAR
jgi:hypothetical protein